MAPTIPCFHPPRGRVQCAPAAIAISSSSSSSSSSFSSGSDQSVTNTLIIVSSATSSRSRSRFVVTVRDSSAGRGGDEGRGGQRSAPRHRRPPSLAPIAVRLCSPSLVTAASVNGSGRVATSRQTTAAPQQCPSSCSVLSVRAPGGVAPSSLSSSDGDDDEATSRLKTKAPYRKWQLEDERKILDSLAELRRDNFGVLPQVSVLLKKICANGGLSRRGVDAAELSGKVYQLKEKFKRTAAKVAASGRRIRKYRNQVLYRSSLEVWPHVLPGDAGAAVRETRAARR